MEHTKLDINSHAAVNIQGIVAKLLAKEDVTVHRSSDYHTASFNIKTRVMEVPLWKTANKEVYDLFIGHEIGHARWTSMDNAEEFQRLYKGHQSLYNILEDIRIEKMAQKEFPGLIRSFKTGYEYLLANKFFGDISKLTLLDKINLIAKVGSAANIVIKDNEKEIVAKALAITTHEDLINVARELIAFVIENKITKETGKSAEKSADEINDISDDKESVSDSPEKSEYTNDTSTVDDSDSDEKAKIESEVSEDSSDEDDSTDSSEKSSNDSEKNCNHDSTDSSEKSSNDSEKNCNDDSKEGDTSGMSHGLNADDDATTVDSELTSPTQDNLEKALEEDLLEGEFNEFIAPSKKSIENVVISYTRLNKERTLTQVKQGAEFKFTKEYNEIKKIAAHLKGEFERKKAGLEYTHARESQVGKIDVNALHRYKFDDNIFQSITELAQGKSHGIFMLLDFSGSMCFRLQGVVKQALVLTEFCKIVNIPFEVYSFTTKHTQKAIDLNEITLNGLHMVHLLSSSMKKNEYKFSAESLLTFSIEPHNRFASKYEIMSGTPLNQAIIASTYLLKEFIAKHKIQIPSFFMLTDGHGCGLYEASRANSYSKLYSNKLVKIARHNMSKILLENLKNVTKANTLWYYLCKTPEPMHRFMVGRDNVKALRQNFKKTGIYVVPKVEGVDKYIILRDTNNTNTDIVKGDEKEMRKSFMAKCQSKGQWKIFAREVVDGIAKLI